MSYYLTLLARRKKTPAVIRARYHQEWYKAGMGIMRRMAIWIFLLLIIPAEFNAAAKALIIWIWPRPTETPPWAFSLIFYTCFIIEAAIILTVVYTLGDSLKKYPVDKDS
jgi:amino acid permease